MGRRAARPPLLLLVAVMLSLGLITATRAEALVYWVNNGSDTIGRAKLDGKGVEPNFITVNGAVTPTYGVAVDEKHIFWASASGWIGRAKLDGTGVNPTFIPTAAGGGDSGIALDKKHIYWANGASGWIGRARLNGSGVDQQLLAPQSDIVRGLAVDKRFIYWADYQNSRIGSGELSTLGINPLLIHPTADRPEGLAVDDAHIYWSNGSGDTIGRAKLNGTGVDQSFIPTAYAYGVGVNDAHLFWANYDTNSIGRAKLNGKSVNPSFITGADGPEGVAVDWIVNTEAGFGIVEIERNGKRGTARMVVRVPGPGRLILRGSGVSEVRESATQARVSLSARPKGALKHELATTGRAKAKVSVTFRPRLSSGSKTKTKKLSFRRRV